MIGTIRKHSSWLWIVIIAATIVTFIAWQSPSSRYGDRRTGRFNYGAIDGERVSADEYADAAREAALSYLFTYGTLPDRAGKNNFDEQKEAYQRLFLLRKLNEYNIEVDSASVAQAASAILRNFGRDRKSLPFDPFGGDFERFIRHDLGIQQLVTVVGLSGKLVTPEEAQSLYEHEHREISTRAAFFSGSNYLAAVKPATADAVARFYTNEMSLYRVRERVQVSYVAFGITNLLAQAEIQITNLSERVETNFLQLGTNYARFGKTPEDVKARIRRELIRSKAVTDATRVADEFADKLLNMEPPQAGNLAVLAKTNGLTLKVTRPFDEENGPTEFDGGPNFAKVAFSLATNRPIAEQSLVGEDAVYVIALEKRFPSEIPSLDQIRDRVTADYKYSQAVALARRAGQDFVQAATNGLAHGKTFAVICADAGIKPLAVPPFSISTRELPAVEDDIPLNQFKQIAFSTPPTKVSGFVPSADGGLVVYVEKRLPLDEEKMKADMPAFFNMARRARQQEAVNEWFGREAQKSMRETPLNQPKPAPSAGQSSS